MSYSEIKNRKVIPKNKRKLQNIWRWLQIKWNRLRGYEAYVYNHYTNKYKYRKMRPYHGEDKPMEIIPYYVPNGEERVVWWDDGRIAKRAARHEKLRELRGQDA